MLLDRLFPRGFDSNATSSLTSSVLPRRKSYPEDQKGLVTTGYKFVTDHNLALKEEIDFTRTFDRGHEGRLTGHRDQLLSWWSHGAYCERAEPDWLLYKKGKWNSGFCADAYPLDSLMDYEKGNRWFIVESKQRIKNSTQPSGKYLALEMRLVKEIQIEELVEFLIAIAGFPLLRFEDQFPDDARREEKQ